MNVNYCAIVEPMNIYPDDLRKIMVLLETVLFPTNTVDQNLMLGITNFMREKLIDYETEQQAKFSNMYEMSVTFTSDGEACNLATESNTEVTVSPDFPYPEGTAEKNRAAKKAKKRGKK
jgi:hypothetical protein